MIKKTAIMLLCGLTSTLSMEKIEFMKSGGALAANMTQQQKIEFMRNRGVIVQQIISPIPTEVIETKPMDEKVENIEPVPTSLNTKDKEPLPLNDENPRLNEIIQKINNVPGKNIIINYNVTIKQKVKNSSQNINIGNKTNNY